ncbi:hypothetical protein C8J56DRAFT_887038 [Mycena floridula]|nr:hypothetical protein C8J56DRAFT_887038 [Mycena floridula]
MNFKHGLSTRWATALIESCLHCFMKFIALIGFLILILSQVNPYWILAQIDKATESTPPPFTTAIHVSIDPYAGMPSLANISDSDEAPYDSDSNSDSNDGMPPLVDLSDSDSGYGSN